MNRAEYIASIRSLLNRPKEDEDLQDKELKLKIKQARKWVAMVVGRFNERFQISHTYTMGATQHGGVFNDEDLPSDFLDILYVTNDSYASHRIDYGEATAVINNSYYTPSTTQPFHYIYKNKIGFTPSTLGTNGVLFYIASPTEFDDGSTDETSLDAPYIPYEYQQLVIYKVCIELAKLKPDGGFDGLLKNELSSLIPQKEVMK